MINFQNTLGKGYVNLFNSVATNNIKALEKALEECDSELASFAKQIAVVMAIELNHVEVVKFLLEAVTPMASIIDGDDTTLLMHAVKHNKLELVGLLLEYGADIDAQNAYDMTPLMIACQSGHTEIVELLLEHEADTELRDDEGRSVFDYAKHSNNPQLEEYLANLPA